MNVFDMIDKFIKDSTPVCVFLTNGIKLAGTITYADADGVALTRDGVTQAVMQNSIATVMPVNS